MIQICNEYCYFISSKLITNQNIRFYPSKISLSSLTKAYFVRVLRNTFTNFQTLQKVHFLFFRYLPIVLFLHLYLSQVTFNIFITFNLITLLAIPITGNSDILLKPICNNQGHERRLNRYTKTAMYTIYTAW